MADDAAASRTGNESTPRVARRQELERVIRRHSLDDDAYHELARSYRADGLDGEAKRVLKAATEVFPDDEGFRWELEEVTLAVSLNHVRRVRELMDRLDNSEVETELRRAEADWNHRRLEVCRDRIARGVRTEASRIQMAEALLDMERPSEVAGVLDPMAEHAKYAGRANLLIGQSRSAQGDDLGAMRAWRRAAFERRHPAEAAVRIAALRRLTTQAERLALTATWQHYGRRLASATGGAADANRSAATDGIGRAGRPARSDEPGGSVKPIKGSST